MLQGPLDTVGNTPCVGHSDTAESIIVPYLELLHTHRLGQSLP